MKFILIIFIVSLFGIQQNSSAEQYEIKGKITISHSYCGGATPNPNKLRGLQPPKGFSGKRLFVRKGGYNDLNFPIVDTIVADTGGYFSIHLPQGTYTLISELHLDHNILNQNFFGNYIMVDDYCMDQWWKKGLKTITLKKDTSNNNFHFSDRCFIPVNIPCLQYTGPYPP